MARKGPPRPKRPATKRGFAPAGISERFGANLRRRRLHAGLSQEKLALFADLRRTEVGLLERGEREPRIGTVLKLAAPLEVGPNELLEAMAWQVQHGNSTSTGRRVA